MNNIDASEVEFNLCDGQIIGQMKADGVYDVFMAQINRLGIKGNRIFTGKFKTGDGIIRYISYHCKPGDSGWVMVSVKNPTRKMIETIEQIIVGSYDGPIQTLYVDEPLRRN